MATFSQIPASIRTPGVFIEIDSSRAVRGAELQSYRAVMIGQRRPSVATQRVLEPARITSAKQAETLFGPGSMLWEMAVAWLTSNPMTELWAMAVAEPSGVAATGTLTVTVSSPAAGTINLYIAGRRVQIAVTTSSTQNGLASDLAAAIQADTTLPVGASATTNVVTITHKHLGVIGNDLDLRLNYSEGEASPGGVTVAIGNMGSGAGDIDLSPAWPILKDTQYNVVLVPVRDTVGLASIEAEMTTRWDAQRMIEGVAITATPGSLGSATTLGNSRNSPFVSMIASYKFPQSPHQVAASYAANIARYGNADPARPFQTLELIGILPPKAGDAFTQVERNQLLFDGISTTRSDVGGTVRIERAISMYQTNTVGADDTAYLDLTTLLTLSYLRFSLRSRLSTRYARSKIADDGTRPLEGANVVTPKVIRAECVALAREWEGLGLVENIANLADQISVVRNSQDPTRVDIVMPPDLVNPLLVIAGQIQFQL